MLKATARYLLPKDDVEGLLIRVAPMYNRPFANRYSAPSDEKLVSASRTVLSAGFSISTVCLNVAPSMLTTWPPLS